MNEFAVFDFFYGTQADAYSFYRIPKVLFTDPYFKKLSCEAKLLYGLMLDRMSLSMKNKWLDDQGRVYINFTINEASEMMGCARQTVSNLLSELDTQKGIGLIERKRQGLGKANIIYVKNFMFQLQEEEIEKQAETEKSTELQKSKKQISRSPEDSLQEVQKIDFKKSRIQTSRSPEDSLQEVQKIDFKKSRKQISRSSKNELQEVQKTDCNNTDKNETDTNETEILSNPSSQDRMIRSDVDFVAGYYEYQELIKENIEYDVLCKEHQVEDIDGIVRLMTDTVCTTAPTIRVAKTVIPTAVVRSQLLRLDHSHIEYVMDCLKNTTTEIRGIKNYLLTSLYNSPMTIGHYYTAQFNHDMYSLAQDVNDVE